MLRSWVLVKVLAYTAHGAFKPAVKERKGKLWKTEICDKPEW